MKLSEYCAQNEKKWNDLGAKNVQKFIEFINERINVDLYEMADSKDCEVIFRNLNVWLFNFYYDEFLEALNYINYDYLKYKRNLISSFILSVTRNRENIDVLYNVLVTKGVIDEIFVLEDGKYVIITKDFGEIQFYKANEKFKWDRKVKKYLKRLGDNIIDGCHEIAFFLIKTYPEFKAVTSICNKALDCKYYHSFVVDGSNSIIDLTANLIMRKEDYYLLYEVVELNMVDYSMYLEEESSSIEFDESKTLFSLLRCALYKQYLDDDGKKNN